VPLTEKIPAARFYGGLSVGRGRSSTCAAARARWGLPRRRRGAPGRAGSLRIGGIDPTVSRTITTLAADAPAALAAIETARASARARVWAAAGRNAPDHDTSAAVPRVIDLVATLETSHSEAEAAAPTLKRGFGLHPLCAFVDHSAEGTGEMVAIQLRPSNAGSSTATDHIAVTRAALAQLPDLELRHRRRARAEDRIKCAKDTDLPLHSFDANPIWCASVSLAAEITAWMQLLALTTNSARRLEPKRLRLRLFTLAAALTHHSRQTVLTPNQKQPWAGLAPRGGHSPAGGARPGRTPGLRPPSDRTTTPGPSTRRPPETKPGKQSHPHATITAENDPPTRPTSTLSDTN
jgi:hypothetical protein